MGPPEQQAALLMTWHRRAACASVDAVLPWSIKRPGLDGPGETPVRYSSSNKPANAFQARFAGYAIERKGRILIQTDVKEDHVRIRITDTGKGIPAELHSKIFEHSLTTKKHAAGAGFGLPISRYIVRKHGGEIELTSRLGKGVTFSVYLPIS